ncbi:MAG: glycosyltransferase family 4 protein [Candidatus Sungbacteria bacterium]|nr:glycosyltransferase family 4 protein [Candidatus Sungbacteria bacterium]
MDAQKRKKVLYIGTKSVWGGAQRYVYDLATSLPKDKFEAVVAAGPIPDGRTSPLFEMLGREGIRTIQIPAFRRDINPLKECAVFFQLLKVYIEERPDIIHLNSSKAGGLGALAIFFYKILYPLSSILYPRTIFTVHGWGFLEDRIWIAKKIILFISRLSSLFQDKVILLDRADFAAAEKFIPARKLVLIPNGIKEIDFLARADARALLAQKIERPIAQDTILIGTIAELTKNKGLRYLIEAIGLIKNLQPTTYNLQTLIIGDGEDRPRLQKQIADAKLQDHIFLAGFAPHANQYLKAFDIFVLPSLKEGLPYVVAEAMTAGLPVVASDIGGLPDMISSEDAGILVPPKNAGVLADALQKLAADENMRRKIGTQAESVAKTKFAFHDMLNRTIKLYDTDTGE